MKKKLQRTIETIQTRAAAITHGARVQCERGFSLMEMLIVVALMGLLATFVGANVIRRFDQAKVDSAKIQMKQLLVLLDDFRRVCGFYPTTEMSLDALVKQPVGRECKNYDPEGFIKGGKVPLDPWNNPYDYRLENGKPIIRAFGSDGKEGGEGFDKDINSNELD